MAKLLSALGVKTSKPAKTGASIWPNCGYVENYTPNFTYNRPF
ncbi:hypothetical protein [Vibrio owensii]